MTGSLNFKLIPRLQSSFQAAMEFPVHANHLRFTFLGITQSVSFESYFSQVCGYEILQALPFEVQIKCDKDIVNVFQKKTEYSFII